MGFYPVTAGEPVYTIGSPVFSKVVVHLENGKDFTMVAHNCSGVNKYVQGVKMNGQVRKELFFTHAELMAGGVLELEMGDKPSQL
jgi:putative alpha-1,2-mannosidase